MSLRSETNRDLENVMSEERSKNRFYDIPLSDIKKNELNFYEAKGEEDYKRKVNAISESIQKHGLIHPIKVVKEHDEETQTEYRIISGHTRFSAVCKNYENGIGDGTIAAIIVSENEMDEMQEMELIIESNIQREKTIDQLRIELNFYGKEYERLHEQGSITGKKDAYIAERLGVSERTVRNYRKRTEENSNQSSQPREANVNDLINSLKRIGKSINKNANLAESLGYSSTVSELEHLVSKLNECIQELENQD